MGQFTGKVEGQATRPAGRYAVSDDAWAKTCPATFEWVAEEFDEDGNARATLTITVFAEHGMFKACLNDRQNGRTGWVSDKSFLGLWKAVEKALASGTCDWRIKQSANGKVSARKG